MPAIYSQHRQIFFGLFLSFTFHSQSIADETPATLDEIRALLNQHRDIIELQQDQIESLQNDQVTEQDKSKLSWQGYAVINYQHYDFFENIQDNNPEKRARTDVERFVIAPEYDFGNGYSFFAEIEFEHGGTGSTVEFESEEAGEFEYEIEKGGEVVLEQLYLQVEIDPALNFRFGEMIVPFGMVNTHHLPSEYFTLQRSLAETALIPSVWHEAGVALYGDAGLLSYQLQIITALDSSEFSGPYFVRDGLQGKLEFDNADDLAFVAQVDYALTLGTTLGAAFYIGDSSGNRPRQNLEESALVTLYEIHGRYQLNPFTLRGQYMSGTIDNSDAVTEANLNFFNGDVVGVSRTPVGHKAESWFIEAGYDILPLFYNSPQKHLDLFARYENYNTHLATEGNVTQIARYDRTASTVGVNYKPQPGIIFKAEYSQRTHEGDSGNKEDVYGLGIGFEF